LHIVTTETVLLHAQMKKADYFFELASQ
jgi:hypothetical protein